MREITGSFACYFIYPYCFKWILLNSKTTGALFKYKLHFFIVVWKYQWFEVIVVIVFYFVEGNDVFAPTDPNHMWFLISSIYFLHTLLLLVSNLLYVVTLVTTGSISWGTLLCGLLHKVGKWSNTSKIWEKRKTASIATTGPIPFGPVVILWKGGY